MRRTGSRYSQLAEPEERIDEYSRDICQETHLQSAVSILRPVSELGLVAVVVPL